MLDRLENYLIRIRSLGTFAISSELQASLDPSNLFKMF
ncbi:hypothetical protein NIES2104_54000 [Leptolyngbya sp. NIES-2104]|nr:hypothetical protein NIES2104_54000 [Leptolyngbya sp. NIES-2104]